MSKPASTRKATSSSQELLEPTSLEARFPQLNILGPQGSRGQTGTSAGRRAAPQQQRQKIVEIGADGAFDLSADAHDEPGPDSATVPAREGRENMRAGNDHRQADPSQSSCPSKGVPPPGSIGNVVPAAGGDDDDDDDEEPPPLDDSAGGSVGVDLFNVHAGRQADEEQKSKDNGKGEEEEGPSLMDEMMAAAGAARAEKVAKAKAEEARVKKDFGKGLKKGFFNSGGKKKSSGTKAKAKKSAPKAENKIETLKIDPSKRAGSKSQAGRQTDSLRIDEVQERMQESLGPMGKMLKDGAWITQDLMTKFASNPKLAKGLADPRYAAAISELQKDPKKAMEKFQHDPELVAFLNEFCMTMGDHFTKLGETQPATPHAQTPGGASSTAAPQASSSPEPVYGPSMGPLADEAIKKAATQPPAPAPSREEQAQVDKIMQNRELTELLMDPEMQKVMHECQQPGRLQYYFRHATWGPKLKKLADAGLIRVER